MRDATRDLTGFCGIIPKTIHVKRFQHVADTICQMFWFVGSPCLKCVQIQMLVAQVLLRKMTGLPW
jgi:hypothetical protein